MFIELLKEEQFVDYVGFNIDFDESALNKKIKKIKGEVSSHDKKEYYVTFEYNGEKYSMHIYEKSKKFDLNIDINGKDSRVADGKIKSTIEDTINYALKLI